MFFDKPDIKQVCIFEDGTHILQYPVEALLDHANKEVCKIHRYIPTETLLWAVEPSIELWAKEDTLYHFKGNTL